MKIKTTILIILCLAFVACESGGSFTVDNEGVTFRTASLLGSQIIAANCDDNGSNCDNILFTSLDETQSGYLIDCDTAGCCSSNAQPGFAIEYSCNSCAGITVDQNVKTVTYDTTELNITNETQSFAGTCSTTIELNGTISYQ